MFTIHIAVNGTPVWNVFIQNVCKKRSCKPTTNPTHECPYRVVARCDEMPEPIEKIVHWPRRSGRILALSELILDVLETDIVGKTFSDPVCEKDSKEKSDPAPSVSRTKRKARSGGKKKTSKR